MARPVSQEEIDVLMGTNQRASKNIVTYPQMMEVMENTSIVLCSSVDERGKKSIVWKLNNEHSPHSFIVWKNGLIERSYHMLVDAIEHYNSIKI